MTKTIPEVSFKFHKKNPSTSKNEFPSTRKDLLGNILTVSQHIIAQFGWDTIK